MSAVWAVVEDVTGDVWVSRCDERSVAESIRRRLQGRARRSFSVVKVNLATVTPHNHDLVVEHCTSTCPRWSSEKTCDYCGSRHPVFAGAPV